MAKGGADQAPGAAARTLVRACDRAGLATAMAGDGWPYASLAIAACDHAGAPLLLISDLAEHTRNLKAAGGRCALLFDGTGGADDPLSGPRVTLLGRLAPCDDARLLGRFLARHPAASLYSGFGDFHLYRLAVERAHLIGGFGRIRWIGTADLLFDPAGTEALAEAEAAIVAHMNDEHRDAVQLYARLLGRPAGAWRMTGLDPEGVDLRDGGDLARLNFDEPVRDPAQARNALVQLVKRACTAGNRAR